jgi:hypothetical protein
MVVSKKKPRPVVINNEAGSLKLRGAEGRNRTTDTRIFSPLLYRLSYLGTGIKGHNNDSPGSCQRISVCNRLGRPDFGDFASADQSFFK